MKNDNPPWPYTIDGCYDPPPVTKAAIAGAHRAIDEYAEKQGFIQKTLHDGTKIQVATPRIGDAERRWAVDKISEMHVLGFLDEDEYNRRIAVASESVTRNELNETLTGLPDDPEEWRQARKIPSLVIKKTEEPNPRPALHWLVMAGVLLSFIAFVVTPFVAPNVFWWADGGIGLMMTIFGLFKTFPKT